MVDPGEYTARLTVGAKEADPAADTLATQLNALDRNIPSRDREGAGFQPALTQTPHRTHPHQIAR